jgi:uncharacterized protein (TIGR02118 family)
MLTLHLFFRHRRPSGARLSVTERKRLAGLLRAEPGAAKALIFTPEATKDPFLDDGPPPLLGVQLDFADSASLAAFGAKDLAATLASADAFPSLAGTELTAEAIATRVFPVPDPRIRATAGAPSCSYLVAYDGTAADPGAWIGHYVAHHVPIMTRLPGIRRIEVGTPLDWSGPLPGRRTEHLLRNKVVFDDAAALTAALNSPVRHEMRADFLEFPRFEGKVTHYPFATWAVVPGSTGTP